MTYRDLMRNTCKTLAWCECLSYLNGKLVITHSEGTIDACVDGKDVDNIDIKTLAKMVNPYYDDYIGYDDKHILLDAKHEELPCCDCPWFEVCEAMSEEI